MPRIPKKTEYWKGKKHKQGELQAKLEYDRKKPLSLMLKEKLMDTIKRVDPLEAAAVVGLTALIKPQLGTMVIAGQLTFTQVFNALKIWAFPLLGFPEFPTEQEIKDMIAQEDLGMWVFAFVVSFLIVRHFGSIVVGIGEATGNLTSIVKMLLPKA